MSSTSAPRGSWRQILLTVHVDNRITPGSARVGEAAPRLLQRLAVDPLKSMDFSGEGRRIARVSARTRNSNGSSLSRRESTTGACLQQARGGRLVGVENEPV